MMDVSGWSRLRGKINALAAVVLSVLLMTAWLAQSTFVQAMQKSEQTSSSLSRYEQGATSGNVYVGQAKCITCHKGMSSAASTPMGEAAAEPLRSGMPDYSTMSYQSGQYTVRIEKNDAGMNMKVSDGSASLSVPVRWIFGKGYDGQTFLLEKDGQLYESRSSYYAALGHLDKTIGHSNAPPASLMAALGRALPKEEVERCFSCHTSENLFAGRVEVQQAHPGVTCENCHGAGSEHVALMSATSRQTPLTDAEIFNPASLAPADLNDFCGSCHRTTRDVMRSGVRDIRNVRFQPYRLENSRCYDPSDERIQCTACHDPHRKLETSSAVYDQKCLACHASQSSGTVSQKAPACPRATKDCASCHMPKLNLPGAHFAFTDHYIRVVKPGEPYPD
ncbi:MAG: multiheme c-type cytochrome [Acidobacteriaceae bacterium]|nr:multiheme c-type cytochrome [Acidobacteriaceae bacterium]